MTGLGCNEVGELDGGGSSQLWAEAGEDAVFRGATTAHGGHVMKPRDTNPVRAVANGVFVLPAQVEGAWRIGTEDAVFAADEPRGGIVRVEISLSPVSGHLPGELPSLLAEAALRGDRAAIATVEEDDGSLSLRGLALVDGAPEWVELDGVRVDAARPTFSPPSSTSPAKPRA